MLQVKKFVRGVKEAAMDYDEVQLRVRMATSNDPVGADDRLMARIAHDTRDRMSYNSMFTILWKRMTDLHQPSHILKALLLTQYLLVHGDDRFVRDMRSRVRVIKRLTGYKFYLNHEDVGEEVRTQSRELLKILADDSNLDQIRKESATEVLSKADDRYDRQYESNSPNRVSNNPYNKPNIDAPSNSFQPVISPEEQAAESEQKEKRKKEKKKKKKKKVNGKGTSFDESLSEDDPIEDVDVRRISQAMAASGPFSPSNTPIPASVDLLTGLAGPQPVDWMSSMHFGSSNVDAPAAVSPSQSANPLNAIGSPEVDGFAFDGALEIGSDDETPSSNPEKDFWSSAGDLVDISDLRGDPYGDSKQKKKVGVQPSTTGALTLAQIASGRTADSSMELSIRPIKLDGNPFGGPPTSGYSGFPQPMPIAYPPQPSYNNTMQQQGLAAFAPTTNQMGFASGGYHPGFAMQQGYSSQQGYPLQQPFPLQQGYPAQQGYPPQQGYPSQQGYAPAQAFPLQQGYAPFPTAQQAPSQAAKPSPTDPFASFGPQGANKGTLWQ